MTMHGAAEQQLALPIDTIEIGSVKVWVLRYPFLPPSKNVYESWPVQWKSSAKKKWYLWTKKLCEEQGVPMGLEKVGLAAQLTFPTRQRRDPQNYAQSLWHWLPDALVKSGVLLDDHDGCIEIGPQWGLEFKVDGRTQVNKKHRQRTTITIAARTVSEDEVRQFRHGGEV